MRKKFLSNFVSGKSEFLDKLKKFIAMENEQRKENNNKSRQEKRQERNLVQSDEEKAERFRKDRRASAIKAAE